MDTSRSLPLLVSIGLTVGLTTGLAGQARADWYAGGSIGQSSIDVGTGEIEQAFLIDDDFIATGTTLDENDTGWKAFLGYRLVSLFAVEAAYVDLGEATFRTTIESAPPPNDAITPFDILGTATADGFQVAGIAHLPLPGPIGPFVKVGAFRWEAEFTERIIETDSIRVARTEAETDMLYGVGVKLTLPGPFEARVEWERLENVGKGIGGRDGRDVDYYSAGLVFMF